MEVLTPPQPIPKERIIPPEQPPNNSPNFGRFLFFMAALLVLMAVFKDFVIQFPDGSYDLKPERKEDLERRKKQIDNAEQYVLLAKENGWYPCHNCGEAKEIFLYIGEVWKYGVSKHGSRRYRQWEYRQYKFEYHTQYIGTVSDCLQMELEKIYYYPILPENLRRNYKLPRPPGNKVDF